MISNWGTNLLKRCFRFLELIVWGFLEYINLIPRKNREEALFNWLITNKYYPDGILNNTKGFLSKYEFGLQNHHKLIVTIL